MMARSLTALVCLGLCLIISSNLRADSFVSAAGYPYGIPGSAGLNYAVTDPASQGTILRRIENILYPVMGMPAIVQPGGALMIVVHYKSPDSLLDPHEWIVNLTTASGGAGATVRQRYTLPVETVDFNWTHYFYIAFATVPEGIPADTYFLELKTDFFTDTQPNAVAVRNPASDFRIVHLADLHFGDPTSGSGHEMSPHEYPGYDATNEAASIRAQVLEQELRFWNPDLVVVSGDLGYGSDANSENGGLRTLLEAGRVPTFLVPGHRDGLVYLSRGDVDVDGLEAFERAFGPRYFSFDWGMWHFLGANSYDGSAARRQAKTSLFNPAPQTDNSGGFLSPVQSAWVQTDLEAADTAGADTIIFLHHDPRGPFTADAPYGTDPNTGAPGDEEWNFDGAAWDSDPSDYINDETDTANTGITLLRWLAEHPVRYVFIGHDHEDDITAFAAGDTIEDRDGNSTGVIATHDLTFVRTTALAGAIDTPFDYWGYRLVSFNDDEPYSLDFSPAPLLGSVPAGNVFTVEEGNDGAGTEAVVRVTNSLPVPATGRVILNVAASPTGYTIIDVGTNKELPAAQVGVGEDGATVLYVDVTAEPGNDFVSFPERPGAETVLKAEPRSVNAPPSARVEVEDEGDGVYLLRAVDVADPDGDAVARVDWILTDGSRLTGREARYFHKSKLREHVTLWVTDEHGARGSAAGDVGEDTPPPPDPDEEDEDRGCGS